MVQKYKYSSQKYATEYEALRKAKQRCHNEADKQYKYYGARGIEVCELWRSPTGFDYFLEHIGPKPHPKLTLDRIDNDKGYEPGNVRWATMSEQNANKRNTSHSDARRITFNGETLTIGEWSKRIGIDGATLRTRLDRLKWTVGKALGYE